jgi:hypothetical protein
VKRWVRLLLEGRRSFIVAGNDAHGNFNRFRQLGLPFLSTRENNAHRLGYARTAVHIEGTMNRVKVMDALRAGRCAVTTGPSLLIRVEDGNSRGATLGQELSGQRFIISVRALSTEEFGGFQDCRIWLGDLEAEEEHLLWKSSRFSDPYRIVHTIVLEAPPERAYIRGEVHVQKKGQAAFSLTNPIWIRTQS